MNDQRIDIPAKLATFGRRESPLAPALPTANSTLEYSSKGENDNAEEKKHSKAEIASMLAQADELARQGRLQTDIARTLGVSVMTLHRWRKAPLDAETRSGEGYEPSDSHHDQKRIADLQLENSRLRHLVTGLLLEKMDLEEIAQKSSTKRRSR